MSSKELFSLDYLNEIGGNNPAFTKSIIELFIKETPENLNILSNANGAKDFSLIKLQAHKLKSSLRAISATHVADIAAEIEAAALNNDASKTNALLQELQSPLEDLTISLKDYLAKHP